ncbi:MAG: 4-(cytidine 5'-diphospho)-2-C-methyl-D-erythritol kinase [Proteobacteria bacterium]|nr:4-(cytidine 5'-diphospho)-2-C-methyl-D-erythritol kinase [Pseudomonadota bacterium]
MIDIKCHSPAKINLFLYVTGRRPDGYHTLYSLMCRVKYGDTLEMTFGGEDITVGCNHQDVPGNQDNIVYKAASLFYSRLGQTPGVHIRILKKIPVGAGLGGGSSNAASTFLALNRYYNSPFSREDLMTMGLSIGADVPFFIFEQTAIARGVGEQLESVELPRSYKVLLVYPGIHVSTAEVYKKLNFKLTKDKKKNNNHIFCLPIGDLFSARHLWNDLEAVTIKMVPEIEKIKGILMGYEADGALMSGSGSSVFGLFSDEEKAMCAYDGICSAKRAENTGWQVVLTELMI